MASKKVAW